MASQGCSLRGGKVEGSSYRMVVVSASKQMGKGNQHYATIWDVSENFSVFILQDSECRFPTVWVELFGIFSSVSLRLTVFGLCGLFPQVWGGGLQTYHNGEFFCLLLCSSFGNKKGLYGLVSYESRKTEGRDRPRMEKSLRSGVGVPHSCIPCGRAGRFQHRHQH